MRGLGAAALRESGQAMVLAVFTFAILATAALTLTDVVTGASVATGGALASNGAYQAAEAGVDEYTSKLLDDPMYYEHDVDEAESTRLDGSSSLTVSAGNPWTGGISWSYPDGHDTWKQLGNGYAYNLEITPPSATSGGSTQTAIDSAVQIFSTGCRWDTATGACGTGAGYGEREIQTVLQPSSAASWQMIANADIRYGGTATTNGKIYTNGNVTFGVNGGSTSVNANVYASGTVSGSYTLGSGATVYSSTTNPSFSTEIPNPINFSSFLTSIADTKRAAQASGVYLNQATPPAAWEVVFQSNGTFTAAPCTQNGSTPVWLGTQTSAPVCGTPVTYQMPTNGAIYSDQTVIVGSASSTSTVSGRVTITSNANIVVGNDIYYGTNSVLGLVAADNVIVAYWAPSTLVWHAATLAQSGYWIDGLDMSYYNGSTVDPCDNDGQGHTSYSTTAPVGSSETFYGSTVTDMGGCMGQFATRSYNFDPTLLWLDPPWFPTIENPYTVLLQREIPPQ